GSDYTKRMLAYLAAHEELLGPRHDYTLLTVVPVLPARTTEFVDAAVVKAYYDEQAELVLKSASAFAAQKQWRFRSTHVKGHAAPEIAAFAVESKSDLIVMGSHG